MKTIHWFLGMLVCTLGVGCGESDEDDARSADAATGGESAGAVGGAAGDEAQTGGSAGEADAAGGAAGDDQQTGGTAGEGGDVSSTGGQPPTGGTAGSPTGGQPPSGGQQTGGAAGAAGTSEDPSPGGAGAAGAPQDAAGAGGSAGAPHDAAGAGGSAGAPDAPGGSGATTLGFTLRSPEERTVTCSGGDPSVTEPALLMDEDFVCTFVHGAVDGHVYVQATPTDCQQLMGAVPTSFEATGWLSIDGVTTPLEGLLYDHGGNHLNNTIEFVLEGSHYRFAHSSIGFGGRSCQPMDCLQVYRADGTTLVEDGCTVDRTLPVVCAAVESAGVLPLLEDTFAPCPGDPNYAE